jgi:hypothetical protein
VQHAVTSAAAWVGIAGHVVDPHIVVVEPASTPVDESSEAAASLLAFEPDDEQLDDEASRANGAHALNNMAERRKGVMAGSSLCPSRGG